MAIDSDWLKANRYIPFRNSNLQRAMAHKSKAERLEVGIMDNERIYKPILCLDFDGVCHSYTSGWQGVDVIPDPPVKGLFEFLDAAKSHFYISIYSSRSKDANGIAAMREWFSKHFTAYRFANDPDLHNKFEYFLCPEWLSFPKVKPGAFVTLDDRALTFMGEWPDTEDLLNFKPWNK